MEDDLINELQRKWIKISFDRKQNKKIFKNNCHELIISLYKKWNCLHLLCPTSQFQYKVYSENSKGFSISTEGRKTWLKTALSLLSPLQLGSSVLPVTGGRNHGNMQFLPRRKSPLTRTETGWLQSVTSGGAGRVCSGSGNSSISKAHIRHCDSTRLIGTFIRVLFTCAY